MSTPASAAPRTRRGRETREALVRAARKRFIVDGYLNVSVHDIAATAQRSPASFYTYFDSKADLLQRLAADAVVTLDARLRSELAAEGEPSTLVARVTRAVWEVYRDELAVLVSVFQTATRDLELADWTRLRETLVATVAEVNRRAVGAGAALPGDELMTARVVASLLEFSTFTWLTERRDSPATGEVAIDEPTAIAALTHIWKSALWPADETA